MFDSSVCFPFGSLEYGGVSSPVSGFISSVWVGPADRPGSWIVDMEESSVSPGMGDLGGLASSGQIVL